MKKYSYKSGETDESISNTKKTIQEGKTFEDVVKIIQKLEEKMVFDCETLIHYLLNISTKDDIVENYKKIEDLEFMCKAMVVDIMTEDVLGGNLKRLKPHKEKARILYLQALDGDEDFLDWYLSSS